MARDAVRGLRASAIREVANAGMGLPDVVPFWFGEPAQSTPDFIVDAAERALRAHRTYYTPNLGITALREMIAAHVGRLHDHGGNRSKSRSESRNENHGEDRARTRVDHIAVTSGGVHALMLAAQLLVGPGDRVVAVTPLWPNLVEIPKILGANVHTVSLDFGDRGWRLDIDRLLAALTPDTRLVLINSPNNPTGWTMSAQDQQRVLDHCRQHGIWTVADEVYERLYYPDDESRTGIEPAPSFLDIADRDERVIAVNSFSKSWVMTGWRLGWMVLPRSLTGELAKIIEYNTSCAVDFAQHAGIVAVRDGEEFTRQFVRSLREARDHLHRRLSALPGVTVQTAPGAMYLFFRIAGMKDSLEFCKALVRDVRLGLAPGIAFGPEGEGYLRWCYAGAPDRLDDGVERLARFLKNR